MSAQRTGLFFVAAAFVAAGCGTNDEGAPPPAEAPFEHPVTADGTPVGTPPDLGGVLPTMRGTRRMNIDTLQASMTRVAGNDIQGAPIRWRQGNKDGFSDDAFGKALGRPDYRMSTDESGVSNALYMKFVGDAARDICMQMAEADLKRAGDARVLFPKVPVDGAATDAQITENLRYLVLRFLGLRVAADHEMIAPLRAVYDAGAAIPAGGALPPRAEGFRGVCVALFESPLFHND
jgi:hypothetical protein